MAALTLLSTLPFDSAFAAGPDREREPRRIKVERTVKLQPQPGTEVIVPELKALFLSDGSVTLAGKGSVRVDAPPQGFDFEVDLARGTYVTRRVDQQEIEERDRQRGSVEKNGQEGPLGGPVIEAITPGSWSGRVRVQTKDPAFILLAETMTRLTWSVATSGTVTWQSYSDSCWAANPSSLGTHWFVSYCLSGAPWYASTTRVCNENRGDYYNYDFAFDDQITTASQYAWLCGRNDAIFDYNWTYNDGGEGSLLIYGSVVTG
jgi:hypothetical protein